MNQDLARTILGNIGDGIISVDANRVIVFANATACSILGVEMGSIVDHKVDEVMSLVTYDDACLKHPVDPFGVALSSGDTFSCQTPMVVDSIKNRIVYIEDTASPIKGEDNQVVGAVMVFRDVTEEVQMMTLLKIANERYKVLFESIRSGVAVYRSEDGERFFFVDFNSAAEKIEGMARKDVIGRNVADVFPGVDKLGLLDVFKRVWKTGTPERLPCKLYEDHVRRAWRDNYIYRLPTGEIVAVYDDVTAKRERAEKLNDSIGKLRDNEARMRSLFDNAAIGFVVSSDPPECKIRQANQAFCDMVGYPMDEVIGKSVIELTHPSDRALSLDAISTARGGPPAGHPVSIRKRYIAKDGSIRWGAVFLSKVEYEDGHIDHFAQVVDVTDRKRTEEEKALLAVILGELNSSDVRSRNAIQNIALAIKDFFTLDAIAIRLPERIGADKSLIDYKFFYHAGFDSEFVADESSLCCVDNDGCVVKFKDGTAMLACMCGNVIRGTVDTTKPFFTKNGSFWTNSTSDLLNSTKQEELGGKTRNTCWRKGYESVAIVPFTSGGVTVGSMLLNARRRNAFDQRMIEFLEDVGKSMGVAFARMQMRSDIEENRQALARANGILSVECDVARLLAAGGGGLAELLEAAGRKLKVRWMSFAACGDGWMAGSWNEQDGASAGDPKTIFDMGSDDLIGLKDWVLKQDAFIGEGKEIPAALSKMSLPSGGHCLAIPVKIGGNSYGAFIMSSNNGRRWSKDESNAIAGLATLLCLLAKSEKNRIDLSRKIQESIRTMADAVASGRSADGG